MCKRKIFFFSQYDCPHRHDLEKPFSRIKKLKIYLRDNMTDVKINN